MLRRIISFTVFALMLSFSGALRADYKDKATGLQFPGTIGNMRQDSVTDFEKDHPGLGLGVGIGYIGANPQIYADVFVYNLKLKQIPDGSGNKVVIQQMADAERDIFLQEQRGVYSKVKKIKSASRLLGASSDAPFALQSEFTYTQKNVAKRSFIYLTAYRNNFVKIRFTYPEKDERAGEQALQAFLTEIGKILKG